MFPLMSSVLHAFQNSSLSKYIVGSTIIFRTQPLYNTVYSFKILCLRFNGVVNQLPGYCLRFSVSVKSTNGSLALYCISLILGLLLHM